ncbi:MAG: TRAP transporter large permease subunit [Dysosmobacter welbionis]
MAAPTWPVKLCLFVGWCCSPSRPSLRSSSMWRDSSRLPRTERRRRDDCDFTEQLQGLVAAAEIPAGTLGVALILGLFGLMVVGLVLGQELAFVLGGAGVIVGWLAWGTPGVTIAMTKIYDQMQSYSMVAIPMFVLMANFLTHSKVADGLFESIRYLLGP